MADPFQGTSVGMLGPGDRHYQIVPSDAADLPYIPRLIYCAAAGTIHVRDRAGQVLPYTLERGDRLEFRGVGVTTATTGTFYAWF